MSDTLTTLGLLTLAQEYRGDVVRQINRKTTGLRLLDLRKGEGKNISWAPEFDGAVAENHAEGADAANFGSDAQNSAILNWAQNRALFHLSELAQDGAATSSSPVGNRALWARNMTNATTKLASLLNGQLYTGAGTGTLMTGLGAAIGTKLNMYAGIDGNAVAAWNPSIFDPGTATPIALTDIRADLAAIKVAGGSRPDWALCSPNVFTKVVGLFDATRRYVQDIKGGGKPGSLDAGYMVVEVDGTVFVEDKDATESQIFYINRDHMWLEYLPSAAERAFMEANVQVEADDGFGLFPLGFYSHMLAKTGPSDKAEVLSRLNLVVDKRNAHGVRKNVAIV